jgi:hypothetical protein
VAQPGIGTHAESNAASAAHGAHPSPQSQPQQQQQQQQQRSNVGADPQHGAGGRNSGASQHSRQQGDTPRSSSAPGPAAHSKVPGRQLGRIMMPSRAADMGAGPLGSPPSTWSDHHGGRGRHEAGRGSRHEVMRRPGSMGGAGGGSGRDSPRLGWQQACQQAEAGGGGRERSDSDRPPHLLPAGPRVSSREDVRAPAGHSRSPAVGMPEPGGSADCHHWHSWHERPGSDRGRPHLPPPPSAGFGDPASRPLSRHHPPHPSDRAQQRSSSPRRTHGPSSRASPAVPAPAAAAAGIPRHAARSASPSPVLASSSELPPHLRAGAALAARSSPAVGPGPRPGSGSRAGGAGSAAARRGERDRGGSAGRPSRGGGRQAGGAGGDEDSAEEGEERGGGAQGEDEEDEEGQC